MKPKRTIRPTSDHVHAVMLDETKQTPGGIFIPGNVRKRPNKARVLAVGPGRVLDNGRRVAPRVMVGDIVAVDAYKLRLVFGEGQLANAQGTPYAAEGEEFIVRERDIHGIIESEEA